MPTLLQRYATPLITGLFLVSLISGTALFFHIAQSTFREMHEWLSLVLVVHSAMPRPDRSNAAGDKDAAQIAELLGLLLGLGQLLADLGRLEGQRAGLGGVGELVEIAVDDAAAHRLLADLRIAVLQVSMSTVDRLIWRMSICWHSRQASPLIVRWWALRGREASQSGPR